MVRVSHLKVSHLKAHDMSAEALDSEYIWLAEVPKVVLSDEMLRSLPGQSWMNECKMRKTRWHKHKNAAELQHLASTP